MDGSADVDCAPAATHALPSAIARIANDLADQAAAKDEKLSSGKLVGYDYDSAFPVLLRMLIKGKWWISWFVLAAIFGAVAAGAEDLALAAGLAAAPDAGLFAASVLAGVINEYEGDGSLRRSILSPPEGEVIADEPYSTGTPLGTQKWADPSDSTGAVPNTNLPGSSRETPNTGWFMCG